MPKYFAWQTIDNLQVLCRDFAKALLAYVSDCKEFELTGRVTNVGERRMISGIDGLCENPFSTTFISGFITPEELALDMMLAISERE